MGRKKKKKNRKPVEHPTLFVFDGSIRNYEEGSMLNLHMQVTADEWKEMVTETFQYQVFLECLKSTAFPILKEEWTKEDEWWRLQIEVAVSRMKQIDPMQFLMYGLDKEKLQAAYIEKMKNNAAEVVEQIKAIRSTQQTFTQAIDPRNIDVSGL